ncbi:MAG: sulfite exporter TauE/SafE family protein [bacterium]
MNELSWFQWAVMALAAVIIGLSKSGLPGLGILAIPMVAAVIPAKTSTGFILPMLIVGDVIGVLYYRRHAEWPRLLRLFPWTVLGIFGGWLSLDRLTDAQIRPIIGGIVLVMLALNLWRQRMADPESRIPHSHWVAAIIGLLAGFTTMMANAAGPVMIIYLLAMRLPPAAFLGTSAWYFLLVNTFKVPFSAQLGLITLTSLTFNAMLVPFIAFGAWVGIRFARHIPRIVFERLVQLFAALGAIKLFF